MRLPILVASLIAAATVAALPASPARAARADRDPQPVYVVLADSVQGTLESATESLRGAALARGWQVVAVHDAPLDRATCRFRARVLVLDDPAYSARVLAHGPRAAFALPVRLLLFEDEEGLHVSTVNPRALNRTIVAESGFEDASESLLRELGALARASLHATFVTRGYGQVRERGLIGRTMGIMAGGPFPEKVHELVSRPGGTPADVQQLAGDVWRNLERGGQGRWQVRGVYRLDLAGGSVVVIGVAGDAMEAKSYAIVGAGSDAHRAKFACPGLAHAAAYPIELVVFTEGGRARVGVVEGMYRMKVFFEDAGRMKFAANMSMPGSIEDEIRGLVQAGLVSAK